MNISYETVPCQECGEPTTAAEGTCSLCIAVRGLFAPPPPMIHPDDAAIDKFARAMKFKMAYSREVNGRGGWDDPNQCSVEDLNRMLIEHLYKGDPVDVANFCMMLHHRGAKIEMPNRRTAILEEAIDQCRKIAGRPIRTAGERNVCGIIEMRLRGLIHKGVE